MEYKCKCCGEPKQIDIACGDFVEITEGSYKGEKMRILAVIQDAIITDRPLNGCWSNRVYSAEQLLSYGKVIKSRPH